MFKQNRKPGRKNKEDVGTKMVSVRMTVEEVEYLAQVVKEVDMNRSDFLREALLHYADLRKLRL